MKNGDVVGEFIMSVDAMRRGVSLKDMAGNFFRQIIVTLRAVKSFSKLTKN